MQTCIAIDIGRSALKLSAAYGDGKRVEMCYPSAFSRGFSLTDQNAAVRAEIDTVTIKGETYFVGETAISQGRDDLSSGLTDDWVFSIQHAALFLSAMKRLKMAAVPGLDQALIIVGLPARLYDSQARAYAQALSAHAKSAEIKVIPQSMGPYYQMLFGPYGEEQPGYEDTSWAMIEVGQFTTDFAMIDRGAATQRAFGSCDGMRIAAENLQRIIQREYSETISLVEATHMLISREMKSFGQTVDVTDLVKQSVEPLAEVIVNKAQQIFGADARRLNGICLAGGGAELLRDAVTSKWSKTASGQAIPPGYVKVPGNARFAVSEGFLRFAIALVQSRNAVEA